MGSDDYVCKPFGIKELCARIECNLRKVTKQQGVYYIDDLIIDTLKHKVFQDNKKQHWILTWESGIFLLYPEEKDDLMYSHVDIKSNEHWDMNGCFSITQDDKYGYIWIVSTQGLYALQKRPGNIINTVDISHISSKLNNIFSEIVKDKSGNLWIAAFNEGVSMIDLNKPLVQNYSFPVIREKTGFVTNIKNIYEDKEIYG